jgi:hypothetical protein
LQQIITPMRSDFSPMNLFDCATAQSFGGCRGAKGLLR